MEWDTCTSTIQEVVQEAMHTGNTTSRIDEMPPMILENALPILKREISSLFQL